MNDTQWLFELESLYAKEEQRWEELQVLSNYFRKGMVNLLGLNLMPIEEEIPFEERDPEYLGAMGEEKIFTRLRRATEDEIIPLSMLIGSPEIIGEIAKKRKLLADQEELEEKEAKGEIVEMTPDELDAFMNEGLPEEDIQFIDSPAELEKRLMWESEETQKLNAALVKPLTEKDKDEQLEFDRSVRPAKSKKKARVTLS